MNSPKEIQSIEGKQLKFPLEKINKSICVFFDVAEPPIRNNDRIATIWLQKFRSLVLFDLNTSSIECTVCTRWFPYFFLFSSSSFLFFNRLERLARRSACQHTHLCFSRQFFSFDSVVHYGNASTRVRFYFISFCSLIMIRMNRHCVVSFGVRVQYVEIPHCPNAKSASWNEDGNVLRKHKQRQLLKTLKIFS